MFDDDNLYGRATDVDKRGRYATFGKAVDAAFADLQGRLAEKNAFFDSLADRWPTLFPTLRAVPGRYEDGIIFLYVRSSAHLFAVRPKLASLKRRLLELPGAPKKIELRLVIRPQ